MLIDVPQRRATANGVRVRWARGVEEIALPDDPKLDYVLTPYDSPAPGPQSLRSVNVLAESFAIAGMEDRGMALVGALRAGLGAFRTVYGIKRLPDDTLAWEFYFYDPARKRSDLSLGRVATLLDASLRVPTLPGGRDTQLRWHMFSVAFDASHLHGRGEAEVSFYLDTNRIKGVDRSYVLRDGQLVFENIYSFHHPATEIDMILRRLRWGVHLPDSPRALASVLRPELRRCAHVCVSNKRTCDAVYHSRVDTTQLLYFLDAWRWPPALVDYVRSRAPRLEHLRWDVGFDFRRDGDTLVWGKSGFYGCF